MNTILFNSYNQNVNVNVNIDNNQKINKTDCTILLDENNTNKSKSSDTIEITEKNENIINTKKASDAFKDACSDFGYVETFNGNGADMSLYYNRALTIMSEEGISIPSFIADGQNSTSYLSFIDKVKDFAKDLDSSGPKYLPDSFLDFCDSYKEKLKQYGCN